MGLAAVLLSGGEESTACLLIAQRRRMSHEVVGYFFDYGQPYAQSEEAAARRVAVAAESRIRVASLPVSQPVHGTFPGRNEAMIRAAASDDQVDEVWFGCRAPLPWFDRHGDANFLFGYRLGRSIGKPVIMPLILEPSSRVRGIIRRHGLDPAITYSSKGFDYDQR